jgi:hypothetical protein
MLHQWAKQVAAAPNGATPDQIFPGHGHRRGYREVLTTLPAAHAEPPQQELARLRRENERLRQERDFLKKSGGVLRERVAVKYACIARHRGEYPVRLMCRALEVSPAGFYAAQHRPPSARAQQDQRLRLAIRTAHAASHRRSGAPMIRAELRAQGLRCARKRVARLMRLDGLRGTPPRRFRVTTQSTHRLPIAANHLNRQFSVTMQRERDRVWAADLTYVWTAEGWLYLAVVLDVASRRVIGWCDVRIRGPMSRSRFARSRRRSSCAGPRRGWCIIPIAGCSTPVRHIGPCSSSMASRPA